MSSQGSGEKTEKPSSKKKKDARKKGNVSKSQDLISAGGMVLLFSVVKSGMPGFVSRLRDFTSSRLSGAYINTYAPGFNTATASAMLGDGIEALIGLILPLLLIAALAGSALSVVQTGPLFVPDKLKPDFSRINPLQGFKRLFSTAALMELIKSLGKLALLVVLIFRTIRGAIDTFSLLIRQRPIDAFLSTMDSCAELGVTVGAALAIFALVDIFYQWWKLQKDLRMTKQEVKEENKLLEGDPQIKGRIRRIQRQMSRGRMMKELPTADVVITNPTHYAVALRYRESQDSAPIVVARGRNYLAKRIRETAAEHGVTIVENRPVARALYSSCRVGQEIPADLYQAVADILIYVYQTTGRMPKRQS